jgi:hypothetical protein
LNGSRYCGNADPTKREVHDLDNEVGQCRIDRIVALGQAVTFDTLAEAQASGYVKCAYCIGEEAGDAERKGIVVL